MTREEAIQYLNKLYTRAELTDVYGDMEDMTPYEEALDVAIQALGQIDKIKQIIAIDNSVIEEDVIKYKMICEVVEK